MLTSVGCTLARPRVLLQAAYLPASGRYTGHWMRTERPAVSRGTKPFSWNNEGSVVGEALKSR